MADIQGVLKSAKAHGCFNPCIIDNNVLGFYKTHYIKYINKKGFEESYLFPVTFTLEKNDTVVSVSAILGYVYPDSQISEISYINSGLQEGAILMTESIGNHLYKNLIFKHSMEIVKGRLSARIMSLKVLGNAIYALNEIGFPFMKIANYEVW